MKNSLADDCIVMFTSGATSDSKGVMLSNLNLMHSIFTYRRLLELTPDDISIIPMPMHHITGLAALLSLFTIVGGTLHLHKKFDARRVLEEVGRRGITLIHASPTIFIMVLAAERMDARIKGDDSVMQRMTLAPRLRLRGTTKKYEQHEFTLAFPVNQPGAGAPVAP